MRKNAPLMPRGAGMGTAGIDRCIISQSNKDLKSLMLKFIDQRGAMNCSVIVRNVKTNKLSELTLQICMAISKTQLVGRWTSSINKHFNLGPLKI